MPTALQPKLQPGRVYRTEDLRVWTENPSRLVKRLVAEGHLERLQHGLYACRKNSRFGAVPPSDEELMRAFLRDGRFIISGPNQLNTLRLGSTGLTASTLVYNTKRSGMFILNGRRFVLRRTPFPDTPCLEWYVVDLLDNAAQVGTTRTDLLATLRRALRRGQFDAQRLVEMAAHYSTKATQRLVAQALSPGP